MKLKEKIKFWNIKRKSEYILCPYCLHDVHSVEKHYMDREDALFPKPLFKCEKCGMLFSWQGKKLKDDELEVILNKDGMTCNEVKRKVWNTIFKLSRW